jgi:hypothetical protein
VHVADMPAVARAHAGTNLNLHARRYSLSAGRLELRMRGN